MGNTWVSGQSRSDDVVALVNPAQEQGTEMDRPEAVVDLLEANGVLLERVRDEDEPLLEANRARIGDALDDEVARILDGLLGPPARMLPAGVTDQPREVVGGPMRAPVRRAASIAESLPAAGVEAVRATCSRSWDRYRSGRRALSSCTDPTDDHG